MLIPALVSTSSLAAVLLAAAIANKRAKNMFISIEEYNECVADTQILAKDIYMSLDNKWANRNLNMLVLGGSGTGKSRFIVKPNILQANSSYLCTDPSGELLNETAGFLEKEHGYKIYVLNLKKMENSCRYNPFAYIHDVQEIPDLMKNLQKNINKGKSGGGDPFWDMSALALLTACGAYMFEAFTEEEEFELDEKGQKIAEKDAEGNTVYLTNMMTGEFIVDKDGNKMVCYKRNRYWKGHRNLTNLMNLLRMGKIEENAQEQEFNDLDQLFADWEIQFPNSYAVKQYKTFKMAPAKTALNIMISVGVMVGTYFDNEAVQNLTYIDEMDMDEISKRKTAVYIIIPEGGGTYAFLASMFYTQAFKILKDQAEANQDAGGSIGLKIPVRMFLDEMANIGAIPELQAQVATVRKYNITVTMIYQSLTQMKSSNDGAYEKEWEALVGNCDTIVFLGGFEGTSSEWLSKKLGKETRATMTYGQSYAKQGSRSDNKQQIARNVMDPNEIEQLPNNECIVIVRGVPPFHAEKYHLEEHPNAKYLAENKPEYLFPVTRFHTEPSDEAITATFIISPSDPRYKTVFPQIEKINGVDYEGSGPKYHGSRYKNRVKPKNADSLAGTMAKAEEQKQGAAPGVGGFQSPEVADTPMSEEELKKVTEIVKNRDNNLTIGEINRILEKGPKEAEKILKFKESFDPGYEFLSADMTPITSFKIGDADEEENSEAQKELFGQQNNDHAYLAQDL